MKNNRKPTVWLVSVLLLAIAVCLTFSSCTSASPGAVYVSFLDVGQADCALIECPGGTVLVDTGTALSWRTICAYLQIRDVTQIDYLVLTHAHDDHVGSADEVLGAFDVGCVVMPDYGSVTPTDDSYPRLTRALERSGVPVQYLTAGDSFNVGNAVFAVLGPNAAADGSNDDSIVLRMTYGGTSVLLMADAEIKTENDLLSTVTPSDLHADIIKIGHHGSSGSSSAPFLAAVQPGAAVISCGVGNTFGHPAAQVTELLDEMGVLLYRTDRDGTVVFAIDENGYEKVSK